MDQVATERCYIFKQDRVLQTWEWLKANLLEVWEKRIWSPSSPDCNPFYYFVWAITEIQINKATHNAAD
jgi:hypothetical protein